MKLEVPQEPNVLTPKQKYDRLYSKFLKVINEPLEKNERNSAKDDLKDILEDLRYNAFDVLILFTFVFFLIFVLFLLVIPEYSGITIAVYTLLFTYFLLFFSSLARNLRTALKNVFKPWNEYVFDEALSKEHKSDASIDVIKTRLINNFTLEELTYLQNRVNQDFAKKDSRLKEGIDLLTKFVVVCTILSSVVKDFVGNKLPTGRDILIYALIFGGGTIIIILYRLLREIKFNKLLSSIENAIDHLEGEKNNADSKI